MARFRSIDEFTKPTGTVIGKDFSIHAANFTCSESESMRIDGTVTGDIMIEGVLNVSESGYVEGNISAGYVRIAGRVTGNIQCRNALHITSAADVLGDIRAGALIIDDGAILVGTCQTHVMADDKVALGIESN